MSEILLEILFSAYELLGSMTEIIIDWVGIDISTRISCRLFSKYKEKNYPIRKIY